MTQPACRPTTALLLVLALAGCQTDREDPASGTGAAASGDPVPQEEERASETMSPDPAEERADADTAKSGATEVATFGAGCFWCVEAVFEQQKGVKSVVSGYMGGTVEDPTYKQVCTGTTGHAEVAQITFDPAVITFEELLEVFWKSHDPTTKDRQGADRGTQYRSAVFYHSDAQRKAAEASLEKKDASGDLPAPIVTEITAASTFWPAEDYHQEYYRLNREQPYCRAVIRPKLEKLGLTP